MRVVLEAIFDEGIGFGLNRAFKHDDNPTRDAIQSHVFNELWNAWDRWMEQETDVGAPVRNRQVDGELKTLFELIDQERFEDARAAIVELKSKLGEGEPELTRASWLIRFLEGSE